MPIVKKILRTLRGLQNSCTQQNNLKIVVPRGGSSGRSIPSYRWKSYGAPPKPPYKFEEEGGKEMLEEEEERRAPPRLNSASATGCILVCFTSCFLHVPYCFREQKKSYK